MQKNHYILWKDDNINNIENSIYMKKLGKNIDINECLKSKNEDAFDLIKNKNHAKVKLITNGGGPNLALRSLIKKTRINTMSNFV